MNNTLLEKLIKGIEHEKLLKDTRHKVHLTLKTEILIEILIVEIFFYNSLLKRDFYLRYYYQPLIICTNLDLLVIF